jgi:hypothetical protein
MRSDGGALRKEREQPPKSATDALLDRFDQLIDEQAEKMTGDQFKEAEQKFNSVIDAALASRGR